MRRGMIAMAQCWREIDEMDDPEQRRGAFTGRLASLAGGVEPINRMPTQTGFSVSIARHVDAAVVAI